MKLQLKLALYNTLTKAAIIVFLGVLILAFVRNISVNHIQQRLLQKRTKILDQLSEPEIRDFLSRQGNFTDYNLLREEYFTLTRLPQIVNKKVKFSQENRTIDGATLEYEILTQDFVHNNKPYRLELGETLATVDVLERTISRFTLLVLAAAAIITLIADLFFSKRLLAPFYKIIDEKINLVNDPVHFSYTPIKTTTSDFALLDGSISMLMSKFSTLILTQKEFIANVSHELLTPISILTVRLENLLNEEHLSPEGENKVFANLKTLSRLKAIINSLLMISRIENSQYIKEDQISVAETVHEVAGELEHRLLMKELQLSVTMPHDYTFMGNASLFTVLLTNIINNAIKYNVQGGKIAIAADNAAEQFFLSIKDTGRGMDASEIERAFGRFQKLHSTDEESYGLGLAIVRHIAEFHGILIEVNSAPGIGTEVKLIFEKS